MSSDSIREPTDQQRRAITATERNAVVVAGAGTGKTFVLVRRFVSLLEANPDWPIGAVVAITFTNRAADEMRARVRAEFEQRRRTAEDHAARRRWSELLAQIEAARITTIHGLCSEIVRANAAVAGVDPAFEVLDAAQAAILRADAVDLALAEVNQDATLSLEDGAAVVEVIGRYNEQDIRKALKDARLLSVDIPRARDLDTLREEWELQALNLFASPHVPMLDLDIPDGNDKLADIARQAVSDLARFNDRDYKSDERFAALRALLDIKINVGSKNFWPDLAQAKEDLDTVRIDAKALMNRIGASPDEQDIDAAVLLTGWIILLQRTRAAYSRLKQTRAALDYDDLERYAAQILNHKAAATRYVGAEFRHVMVDEFQDTNEQQWDIVKRIAPPEHRGALFIVGDPKQSIYGFRGADVTVFGRAQHEIELWGGDVLYLTESFRTHKPLIESLNQLFTTALKAPPEAREQAVYVEFDESQHLQSRRNDTPESKYLATYFVPAGGERKNLIVREARAVARKIKSLVRGQDRLVFDTRTGSYRKPEYGDIALMLRKFTNVSAFERALNDEGIPYITLGGQGFYGRREVKDLLSALRALHNPADELALASALHSPLFAVSDVDLLILRQPRTVDGEDERRVLPLYDALIAEAAERSAESSEYDPLVFSADVLMRLAPLVGRAPVEVLLQKLIHATGYMATLAGLPDGQQMRANVEKLIDRARETGITALNQFVRYLNDMTESESKEGGVALQADNAVRLTTIHSSKGLEYPIVWIADACSTRQDGAKGLLNFSGELGCKLPLADQRTHPHKGKDDKLHPYVFERNNMLAAERSDAESLRLLYVAATRAQDALFVSGISDGKDIKGWLGLMGQHFEPEELLPPISAPNEKAGPVAQLFATEALDFPLAHTLPAAPPPSKLHLSASDIKALGGYFSGPEDRKKAFNRRLRHRIFDETSEPIELLTYSDATDGVGGRRFGTLVHDALRFGYDTLLETDRPKVEALLEAMAWELGITQRNDVEIAVDNARSLLTRYRKSALAREIDQAQAVYRELPFVYQRDGHVIHGYIDLLYRDAQGEWTVVDYKTDGVKSDRASQEHHAKIYCLQLAVYAEAVAAQTGQIPRALLVYLKHPDRPIEFNNAMLAAELEKVPLYKLIEMLNAETG
jgi:ATP-dependent helicase/nuclease subunit A